MTYTDKDVLQILAMANKLVIEHGFPVNEQAILNSYTKLANIANDIEEAIKNDYIHAHVYIEGKEMKHGAFAVSECWSELASIIRSYVDTFKEGVDYGSVQHIELIDSIVDELKEYKLIYLEW